MTFTFPNNVFYIPKMSFTFKKKYNGRETRPTTVREWKEDSTTKSGNCCFAIDAARIWNQITPDIKAAPTLLQAKKVTNKYCKQLPTDH